MNCDVGEVTERLENDYIRKKFINRDNEILTNAIGNSN